MRTSFIEVDAAGRIVSSGCCQSEILEQLPLLSGERIVAVEGDGPIDAKAFWFDPADETLKQRPVAAGFDKTEILADETDHATLVMPEPFEARVAGVTHVIDEPPYELKVGAAEPGPIVVEIDHWPYKIFHTTITAV